MALSAVPGYRQLGSTSAATRAAVAAHLGFISPTPAIKITPPRPPTVGGGGVPASPTSAAAPMPTGLPGVNTDYSSLVKNLVGQFGGPTDTAALSHTPAQDELQADWQWQEGERTRSLAQDTAAQDRANTFRNLIIASGYNPFASLGSDRLGNLAQYSGDINQSTLDTAAGNQFSTRATLDRQLADAQAALPYQLAAAGRERSGAAAQQTNALQRSYDVQSNQALANLLDALNTGAGNYGQALNNAALQWENTKNAVANRLSQQQGPTNQPNDWSSFADALTSALQGQPMALAGTPTYGSPAGQALSSIVPTIQQGTGKKPAVTVPVGYGGGGWAYPVGKTGKVRRY